MFTGIIRDIGAVIDVIDQGADSRFKISTDALDRNSVSIGASIAVNGVCLTVVAYEDKWFAADVSHETLAVTTFNRLVAGKAVNLEPSLRIGDTLDGHWVTGHVDCVGTVLETKSVGRSIELEIELPSQFARYIASKGSVAVDGCSLTVNHVGGSQFGVTVIPHTQKATVIHRYAAGTAVNIEVDIVARYIERLSGTATATS